MSSKNSGVVRVNSRKYDGSIRRTWTGALIERNDADLVLVGEFDLDVSHPDLGEIKRGTISCEYYYLDAWYSIFCFYDPSGNFRNYYCNINMPPSFQDYVLDYIDLDIDVVVWPDGSFEVLDEEEFEANAVMFNYPDDIRQHSATALSTLIGIIRSQKLPRLVPQSRC